MSKLDTPHAQQAETARKIAEAELPIITAIHTHLNDLLQSAPYDAMNVEALKLPEDHPVRVQVSNVVSVINNVTSIVFRKKQRLDATLAPAAVDGEG